jgi:TatA/E family protein of Tat protein translocase
VPLGIGSWEVAILALVIVLVFGPSRLPAIGRRLGRQTRQASREYVDLKRSLELDERRERDAEERSA